MLYEKKEFTVDYGGKTVTLETGRLAKQTDGCVLVTCGGTQVLVTVCSSHETKDGQDFFPLLVDYKEKYYAGGKFLGGYMKREGRPSTAEILLMRMIDRPFRPMFPAGYYNETIIMAQVISYDSENNPEILAGCGAAAALAISDIPFAASAGFCKVGYKDGNYILNPSAEELEGSEIDMIVAAKDDAILMVEGEALEATEEVMLGAINFAHDNIKTFCATVDKMVKEVGKTKREYTTVTPPAAIIDAVKANYKDEARKCIATDDKMERNTAVSALISKVAADMKADPAKFSLDETGSFKKLAYTGVDDLMYDMMRADILNEERRIGGRALDKVREIVTETNVLKRAHGSALFTRGETQVLGVATLGGKEGDQMQDSLGGLNFDKFYLHYTFAPFCVGEARGYRGVGRREIGHGNLAERALKNMIQADENFPYTIRVNCEVLESNGSSSMGSVCSGSMALMDAGVPMKAPVAGIAMGLIKDGDNYKILSDILGDEDHLGDMDFKVAGTEKGITAIQMDIKIGGLTEDILKSAMTQAKAGRIHILNEMAKTMDKSSSETKDHAPKISTMKINPDKIGALIGPGGKNIKATQEMFKVMVECAEDGTVKVMGSGTEAKIADALAHIELSINGPEKGKDYDAVVVTIKEYGAFVDIAPGVSGLLHVSEISDDRVNDVNEYLSEGDPVTVNVLDVDRFGKVKFSAKASKAGAIKKKSDK